MKKFIHIKNGHYWQVYWLKPRFLLLDMSLNNPIFSKNLKWSFTVVCIKLYYFPSDLLFGILKQCFVIRHRKSNGRFAAKEAPRWVNLPTYRCKILGNSIWVGFLLGVYYLYMLRNLLMELVMEDPYGMFV